MAWTIRSQSNMGLVAQLKNVERAMQTVDRANYTGGAPEPYHDCPQSIGFGATISAPHMHARCLELLVGNLKQGSHVLDVGSGSGYLAACFAALVKPHQGKVYGIEHIPQLVDRSISNVMKDNAPFIQEGFLELKAGDGYQGYPSAAPFDAIHVGAAAPTIPNALITQLALGGRLVIPVGPAGGDQSLMVIDKVPDVSSPNGWALREESVEGVRYVPLTSVEGQLKGR